MNTAAIEQPTTLSKNICPWTEMVKAFSQVSEAAIIAFAQSINDSNPIHSDSDAAWYAGLDGIVAPGVMILGFISSALAEFLPGCMVLSIEKLRFKSPLYAETSPVVTCTHERSRGGIARLLVKVSSDDTIFADGVCLVRLPKNWD